MVPGGTGPLPSRVTWRVRRRIRNADQSPPALDSFNVRPRPGCNGSKRRLHLAEGASRQSRRRPATRTAGRGVHVARRPGTSRQSAGHLQAAGPARRAALHHDHAGWAVRRRLRSERTVALSIPRHRPRPSRQPARALRDEGTAAVGVFPRPDAGQVRRRLAGIRRRRRSPRADVHHRGRRYASRLAVRARSGGTRRHGKRTAALHDRGGSATATPTRVSRARPLGLPAAVCILPVPARGAAGRRPYRARRGCGGTRRGERPGALQAPSRRLRSATFSASAPTTLCRCVPICSDETDGPTLVHGIQELHGTRITVPRKPTQRPDQHFSGDPLQRPSGTRDPP